MELKTAQDLENFYNSILSGEVETTSVSLYQLATAGELVTSIETEPELSEKALLVSFLVLQDKAQALKAKFQVTGE